MFGLFYSDRYWGSDRQFLFLYFSFLFIASGSVVGDASEALSAENASPLTQLRLEELLTLEVTTVSKKTERMSQAAAAVFFITQDDTRRSGAMTISGALRMVSGVHVARLNANKWGVSVRNFNDRFAGKLLVLIDGRSIYTPLFSGVYWEFHDIPMKI